MAVAFESGRKRRVGSEIIEAEHGTEAPPLQRRDDGDTDPAIARAVDTGGISRPEAIDAEPLLPAAEHQSITGVQLGIGNAGFQYADLDGAAGIAPAAGHQGGQDGDGASKAADGHRLKIRRHQRWTLGEADELNEAGERATDRIRAGEVRIRATAAEP